MSSSLSAWQFEEHPHTTRCACGNVWRPMAWDRVGNVKCSRCGGWNQVGVTDLRYRPPGTIAVLAAVRRALRR